MYGDKDINYRVIKKNWHLVALNMLVVAFCMAIPGLVFAYLIVVLSLGGGRRR